MERTARSARSTEGWPLVGWAAVAVVALCAATLAVQGAGEEGVRAVIRATARSSLVLFLAAFTASSLRRLWPNPATAWLLRNRRQLGVSFAVSHTFHALAIGALAAGWPASFETSAATLYGGGAGYVFLYATAATSSDRAVAWVGRRRWRQLHLTGGWVLWTIFLVSYLPEALAVPTYAPFAAAVLAAGALRVAGPRLAAGRRAPRGAAAS